MTKAAPKSLDLQQIFTWLLADGIVTKEDVKKLYTQAQVIHKNAPLAMHPLTAVAQCKLSSAWPPHRLITLDWLGEWMAGKVKLPFFRIDPLKIDFTKVADVMSATYAARFHILPVELTATELTIATADPYAIEWEAEIAKISRIDVFKSAYIVERSRIDCSHGVVLEEIKPDAAEMDSVYGPVT